MHGETIPYGEGDFVLLLREPVGVAGVVLPRNGPAVMFGRTVAAALAAGNCCVVKPAEDASLSVLFLAVRIANSTPFGLVAGVWARDGGRHFRMASRVRSGQVFINSYLYGSGVELPFGGTGRSGHGREKGLEALKGLTRTKTVVFRNS